MNRGSRFISRTNGQGLWGLVNNAGIGGGGPLLYQPLTEVRRMFEINVWARCRSRRCFCRCWAPKSRNLIHPAGSSTLVPLVVESHRPSWALTLVPMSQYDPAFLRRFAHHRESGSSVVFNLIPLSHVMSCRGGYSISATRSTLRSRGIQLDAGQGRGAKFRKDRERWLFMSC
jgi:NAD(P)-dependent dehydrogenase (short-subunit alcohol dehydrogenase family)